jgi:hypothetical protein
LGWRLVRSVLEGISAVPLLIPLVDRTASVDKATLILQKQDIHVDVINIGMLG